jgi:hypothetical protein
MVDNKGQLSLEAIMIVGVAMVVLISFINLNFSSYYTARDIGESGEAKMVGQFLATAINNVYANGGGFSLYLGEDKINFTKIGNDTSITGLGVNLPIVVDPDDQTINISRRLRSGSNSNWNTTIKILPKNITRANPTGTYPEVTILNNGTYIIIYANSGNIDVRT